MLHHVYECFFPGNAVSIVHHKPSILRIRRSKSNCLLCPTLSPPLPVALWRCGSCENTSRTNSWESRDLPRRIFRPLTYQTNFSAVFLQPVHRGRDYLHNCPFVVYPCGFVVVGGRVRARKNPLCQVFFLRFYYYYFCFFIAIRACPRFSPRLLTLPSERPSVRRPPYILLDV